jgi:hypothetical protein
MFYTGNSRFRSHEHDRTTNLKFDCDQLLYLFYLVEHRCCGVQTWDMYGRGVWIGLPSRWIRFDSWTRIGHSPGFLWITMIVSRLRSHSVTPRNRDSSARSDLCFRLYLPAYRHIYILSYTDRVWSDDGVTHPGCKENTGRCCFYTGISIETVCGNGVFRGYFFSRNTRMTPRLHHV